MKRSLKHPDKQRPATLETLRAEKQRRLEQPLLTTAGPVDVDAQSLTALKDAVTYFDQICDDTGCVTWVLADNQGRSLNRIQFEALVQEVLRGLVQRRNTLTQVYNTRKAGLSLFSLWDLRQDGFWESTETAN